MCQAHVAFLVWYTHKTYSPIIIIVLYPYVWPKKSQLIGLMDSLWQWCHNHQIHMLESLDLRVLCRPGLLQWGQMFQTWILFLSIPWCVWTSGSLSSVLDSFIKPVILFLVLFILSFYLQYFDFLVIPVPPCPLLCPDHFNSFSISRRFSFEHDERAAHTPRGLPIHSANLISQLVWNLLHFDFLNLEVFDLLGLLVLCCALGLAFLQKFKTRCHLGESICQKPLSWRKNLIYRRGQSLVKQGSQRWRSRKSAVMVRLVWWWLKEFVEPSGRRWIGMIGAAPHHVRRKKKLENVVTQLYGQHIFVLFLLFKTWFQNTAKEVCKEVIEKGLTYHVKTKLLGG